MIIKESGKSRLFLDEQERLNVIEQIRPLFDEGIQILIEDDILPYQEIDALAFRIKEFLTRESRTITKKFEIRYLGPEIQVPVKKPRRPKKLDIHWIDMYHAYCQTKVDPHQ